VSSALKPAYRALQAYPGLMRECRRNLVHWTPDLGKRELWREELRL